MRPIHLNMRLSKTRPSKQPSALPTFWTSVSEPKTTKTWEFQCDMTGAKTGQEFAKTAFLDSLIQDAAYQALLKSTRQQYHQQLAQILENRFSTTAETQPEFVAHHAFQGEVWDKAAAYFRRAGEDGIVRSAHREAMTCFDRALEAMGHLPENRDTMEQTMVLYLALRNVLQPLGESERLQAVLLQAEALAETLDDRPRLGQIYSYMTNYFWWTGEPERAADYGERAVALPPASRDVVFQGALRFQLALAYHAKGDYARSVVLCRDVVASIIGDQLYKRTPTGGLISVVSRQMLAWMLAERGEFVEGIAIGEEGIRIAETAEHQGSIMRICLGVGQLYLLKGLLPQAIDMLERSAPLCQTAETPLWFPLVAAHLGYAYVLSGRLTEAIQLLEQASEEAVSNGDMVYHARRVSYLSEAYLRSGCPEDANVHALQALEFAKVHHTRSDQAYVQRLLGDIAMHRNPSAISEAEAHYKQALGLAKELGLRPLQAHCHASLGMLYRQNGVSERARAELSTAIRMYRDMDMLFWLPKAEETLAEV